MAAPTSHPVEAFLRLTNVLDFVPLRIGSIALLLCLHSLPAQATNPVTEIYAGDIPKGLVALGFGWRLGDSPYAGIDQVGSRWHNGDYDLMPFYYYEGDWLFAHGSSAGVHLLETDGFRLDALINYRFDRLETDADDFFSGVQGREQTLESGLAASVFGDWGQLTLSALGDTMSRHNGFATDLTYRYSWHRGNFSFSPFASAIYHDRDLTDYYYGVSEPESRGDLPQYSADDSAFLRIGINSSYSLSRNLRAFANFTLDRLDTTVRDSPLVDDGVVPQAMLGFAYGFGNSYVAERRSRRPSESEKEWSWRINYGYTAEESLLSIHQGQFQKNEEVDSNLLGLTLGRLLLDRGRASFWGKVSLNRRLEHDYQNDFLEVNAYVMAMGSGSLPGSKQELFRYGFGFGFSYADKVPTIEQVKQADRGQRTSHFLNYLEAQLDFPLRRLFGKGLLEDCYAGLTLVHRSGIFGRADIIGNVAGGSDVLTGHLECKR